MGYEVLGSSDAESSREDPAWRGRDDGVAPVDDLSAEIVGAAARPVPTSATGRSRVVVVAALLGLVGLIGAWHSTSTDDTAPRTGRGPTSQRASSAAVDLSLTVTSVRVQIRGWSPARQVAAVQHLLDGVHLAANLAVRPGGRGDAPGGVGAVGVVADFDRELSAQEQYRVAQALSTVVGPEVSWSVGGQEGQTVSIAVPATGSPCLRGTGFTTAFAPPRSVGDQIDRLLPSPFQSFGTRRGYAVLLYAGPARPREVLDQVGALLAAGCAVPPADVTISRGPGPAAD